MWYRNFYDWFDRWQYLVVFVILVIGFFIGFLICFDYGHGYEVKRKKLLDQLDAGQLALPEFKGAESELKQHHYHFLSEKCQQYVKWLQWLWLGLVALFLVALVPWGLTSNQIADWHNYEATTQSVKKFTLLKETDTKLGQTVMLPTHRLTDADAVEIKLANGKTERFSTDDDFPQKTVKLKDNLVSQSDKKLQMKLKTYQIKAKYRGYRGSKNRQVLVIENRK